MPAKARSTRGLPIDEQTDDTLVVGGVTSAFFTITAENVQISGLSLDGRQASPSPTGQPTGAIQAIGARNFELWNLRLVRVAVGVVSTASSGRVRTTYIGTVQEGLIALWTTSRPRRFASMATVSATT